MANAIDSVTGWFADRYNYANLKFRTPDKAPPYLKTEVIENPGVPENIWGSWKKEQQAKVAVTIPWIYSNIFRITNEVSTADLTVVNKETRERVESDFEKVLERPNEFFDSIALFHYTVWGMYLGMYGGFWYLAPDKNDLTKIVEIWPMPIDRVEPIKSPTKFIKGYRYTSKKGKSVVINPDYVVQFKFQHPWDMWENFNPLVASSLSMSTYLSLTTNTRDLFAKGRGVPLAIVSVSPDVTREDFAIIRQQLREDWESERRIAIARGGDISVANVGISNRDLEIISINNFNRDTLDATYMGGIPWRSDQFKSGEGLREANKQIKEVVIRPLHKIIEQILYRSVIAKHFNPDNFPQFEDVRAQDRSILIQERTIYWRGKSFDEARRDMGMNAYEKPPASPLPDYFGSLPVSLANNAGFVMAISGLNTPLGQGSGNRVQDEELKDTTGNLPGQLDSAAAVNATATGGDPLSANIKDAAAMGMRVEIKRWRTVLLKEWRDSADTQALVDREFKSDIIIGVVRDDITSRLPLVTSEEDIYGIFKMWTE